MHTITLLSIAEIKYTAKKLKTDPSISYTQRQDLAAQKLYGLRHFHEAKQLCKKYIQSLLIDNDGLTYCKLCGMSFVGDLKSDQQEHEKRHLRYEKAQAALNYLPMQYKDREILKEKAYADMSINNSHTIRYQGAINLIRSHYYRSLDSAIDSGYWKDHPSFEAYISMAYDNYHINIPEDLITALQQQYGIHGTPLKNGHTNWRP